MAKAYSDDLRRRFLSAYEAGEGTLEELAERFVVSLAYGKKVHGQFQRTGQMERVEQRRGTPRKLLDGPREQLRVWLVAAPDLTLEQLREKLHRDSGVSISRAQVARALKGMGLKLKKVTPCLRARHGRKPSLARRIRPAPPYDHAGKADLYRRKRRHHPHDAFVRTCSGRPTSPRGDPGRQLANPHPSGRYEYSRHHRRDDH